MTEPLSPQDLHERVRLSETRATQIMGWLRHGTGTPEGNVAGRKVGELWQREDGGAGTGVYVFEGTPGSSTGWRAL